MKKHFAQFYAFITEQQSWFEQHLAADFEQSWDDPVWVCGSNGSFRGGDFAQFCTAFNLYKACKFCRKGG